MVTINVGHYDRETEIQITLTKSGMPKRDAEVIVDLIRELRQIGVNNHRPTIRAGIAIAKVLAHRGGRARKDDPIFRWVCRDVLNVDTVKVTRGGESLMPQKVDELIEAVCSRKRSRKTGN